MTKAFAPDVLLDAALSRFEAALRAGIVGAWPETGLADELQQAVADEVVADVRGRAEALMRSALARNAAIFDPMRPGVLIGQGELISDVVLTLFTMRLPMSIAIHRMLAAEKALAEARGPDPMLTPAAPPPPGLRDIIAPR